jgi:predicted DNA-binding protein
MNTLTVTPRKLHAQPIYLELEKAELLDELSADTRISKAALLREAVDDLLTKHGKLKKAPRLKK